MKTPAIHCRFLFFLLFLAGCCRPISLFTWNLTDADLNASKPGTVVIDNSCPTATETLCDESVAQAFLVIRLNTGEIYNYGKNDFRSTVTLELVKEDEGSSPVTETILLKIYPDAPEILYRKDITSWYSSSTTWMASVKITGYDRSEIIAKDIQLAISVEKTTTPSPYNLTDPSKTLINSISYSGTNPMTFSWECYCPFRQYEFQLLKLYNLDPEYTDNASCSTTLDWSNATSILTAEKKIELSIGEGSGFYAWRVRPIADKFPGGFADDRNWGVWNTSRTEFYKAAEEEIDHDDVFYHESIGDDKNWIFSRFFTEHTRQAEQVTFYNGLLFEKQSQRHLFTDHLNFLKQTFYDYTGRASLSSLGVPIDFTSFQYQEKLLTHDGKLYSPIHFDDDADYTTPLSANGGAIDQYWSDNNSDLTIPSADGYPFSRTLFYPDGTNKPKEFGNVGSTHKIGGNRTIKTYFISATEGELVSMFGDEAPDENNVFKTIVIDPNKTITVTYTDKSGEKLATHLLLNGDTLVEKLPSSEDALKKTITAITYNEQIDDYTIKSNENFVWTQDAVVTIDYKITPQDIAAACGSYCRSCDYAIEIFAKNLETGENMELAQHIIPATYCTNVKPWDSSFTRTLSGLWEIGRIIKVNNKNAESGNTYLADHLSSIADSFESNTTSKLEVLFDHLDQYEIDSFYYAIKNGRPEITVVSEDSTQIKFNTGCCLFTVPKVDCGEDCPDSGKEFEDLLIETWGPGGKEFIADDGRSCNYGCSIYEYFYDPNKLAGTESEYPTPENYYAKFKKIDLSGPSLGMKAVFTLQSCNGLVDDRLEWTLPGIFGGLIGEIEDFFNAHMSDGYDAYVDKDRITIKPDFFERLNGAFISPEAAVTLSLYRGIERIYYDSINIRSHDSGDLFPAGNGAFARLIDNMIADGYAPCDLWHSWQGLVNTYDILSFEDGDPTKDRKSFDLLDAFLKSVGKQYEGVTTCPYADECASPGGYLDNAHKYFYYIPGTSGCQDSLDITSCPPDTRGGSLYEDDPSAFEVECDFVDASSLISGSTKSGTSKKWEEFYTCLVYGTGGVSDAVSDATGIECTGTEEECLEEIIGAINDSCVSYCEERLEGFYDEVLSYYEEHHLLIDSCMILCKAYTMMDSCKQNCNFNLDDILNNGIWAEKEEVDMEDYLNSANICDILEGLVASMTNEWEYEEPFNTLHEFAYWRTVPDVHQAGNNNDNDYDNEDIIWDHAYDSMLICPEGYGLYYDYLFSEPQCYADQLNALFLDDEKEITVDDYLEILDSILHDKCPPPWHLSVKAKMDPARGLTIYVDEPCSLMVAYFDTTGLEIKELICDQFDCIKSCPVCIKTVPPEFTLIDTLTIETCEQESAGYLSGILERQIEECRDSILTAFENNYGNTCGNPANIKDQLTVSYEEARYHFTLFFYDRAGNLVTTVPPKGADVDDSHTRLTHPDHTFKTIYNYNSLGQLIQSESPDGGKTTYIYDDIGLLRFSRNARQSKSDKYSYIKYDNLGRIIETGENNEDIAILNDHRNELDFPTITGTERTFTSYTTPGSVTYLDGTSQRFLRNNVSYMYNDDKVYTYYSYDPHGNVEWMIQDIPGFGKSYIKYEYDLVSGLVTEVKYNEGLPDQFYQRYTYDADNRIREVQTSTDNAIWDTDARYQYYGYGPLKRMTLGEDFVQGLDYVYTIQGWLKAINHQSLEISNDPGHDSDPAGPNSMVAKDVHALTLSYYSDDFKRTYSGTNSPFNAGNAYSMSVANPLYDGNIAVQTTSNAVPATDIRYGSKATAFNYQYDELSRLLQSTFNYYSSGWKDSKEYHSQYTYDPNGNILTLGRNAVDDARGLEMDKLTYNYPLTSNQLDHVDDAVSTISYDDLGDQGTGNYEYDELGNMIKDDAEGIEEIQWNLQGKVKKIMKSDGSELSFGYDAMGNRAWKTFTASGASDSTTYYVCNAMGQPIALYPDYNGSINLTSTEWLIYGQSRIGSQADDIIREPASGSGSSLYQRYLGRKSYELTNHLSNVQTTISDIKLSTLDDLHVPFYFRDSIISYQDYYPYGSPLPENLLSSSLTRFGFNGMEKEDEIFSSGHSYNFKHRFSDATTCKWFSVDGHYYLTPSLSPFQQMIDNPIYYRDPNGMQGEKTTPLVGTYLKDEKDTNPYRLDPSDPKTSERTIAQWMQEEAKPEGISADDYSLQHYQKVAAIINFLNESQTQDKTLRDRVWNAHSKLIGWRENKSMSSRPSESILLRDAERYFWGLKIEVTNRDPSIGEDHLVYMLNLADYKPLDEAVADIFNITYQGVKFGGVIVDPLLGEHNPLRSDPEFALSALGGTYWYDLGRSHYNGSYQDKMQENVEMKRLAVTPQY